MNFNEQKNGFQQLVDEVIDHMGIVVNHEGEILAWNKQAEAITGYHRNEVQGRKLFDFIESAGFNKEKAADKLWCLIKTKNGKNHCLHLTVTPINVAAPTGKYLLVMKSAEGVVTPKDENILSTYMAMHELQEPLRRILLHANMLRESPWNIKATIRGADKITKDGNYLLQWIRSMLDYARTTGNAPVMEKITLHRVIAEVKENLGEFLRERKAVIDITSALPMVRGNKMQLTQLFSNLIENAIKYNVNKPHITLTAETQGDMHAIKVHDNGIGFEPGMAEKIFELFVRNHTNAYPGHGIGLALCRKIAETHGGSITAESTLGKGSVFTVYLPAID